MTFARRAQSGASIPAEKSTRRPRTAGPLFTQWRNGEGGAAVDIRYLKGVGEKRAQDAEKGAEN